MDTSTPSVASQMQLRLVKRALAAARIVWHADPSNWDAWVTYYAILDVYEVTLLRWFAEMGWQPPDLTRSPDEPAFMALDVPDDEGIGASPEAPA